MHISASRHELRGGLMRAGIGLEADPEAAPSLLQTYGLTVSWLGQIGQADIQAAANLQAMAQADAAAGHAQGAYLESVGAQLAMQIQTMPPGQHHALTQRVPLGGQWAADVTVSGGAGDRRGLAGFGAVMVDTDPGRTRLVAAAQAEAAQAGQSFAQGNILGGFLNLGAAVGVGFVGLGAVSQAGVGAEAGSFAADAGKMAEGIAGTLGFVGTEATATAPLVTAAQAAGQVGAEVLESTALLGGLSGAAQSAARQHRVEQPGEELVRGACPCTARSCSTIARAQAGSSAAGSALARLPLMVPRVQITGYAPVRQRTWD